MQIFLFVAILIFMLFSDTVSKRFGMDYRGTATTLLFCFPIFKSFFIDRKKVQFREMKPELFIITTGIILGLIQYFNGDSVSIERTFFFMIFPMLVSMALSNQSFESKRIIQYLILGFFIAECSLAIFEKIENINLFPYVDIFTDMSSDMLPFRSCAFLGHPLTNALVVSTILGFILISDMRLSIKGLLFILGLIAILCFNARGATLIWIVISIISFFYIIKDNKIKKSARLAIFLFLATATGAVCYLIFEKGFADRLVNDKIYDKNAKARVDVFAAFSYIDSRDLIFGNSDNYLYVTDKLGEAGVENSYIAFILYYGIPVFILLLPAYYLFLKKHFKNLTFTERSIICFSFIVVGSTNNSLIDYNAWMFFIFCSASFIPNTYSYELNRDGA